jgi:imidazolonepropionase-like amidohydrolase
MIRSVVAAACLTACARPSGLVISNVTVVSPERAAPLAHAYVRILDGKIAAVSESRLRGETEIDGTGRYLIPGLIDSHVHLALAPGFPSGMTAEQAAAHPDIVAAALAQDPRSYVFFGFTTVVDLFGTAQRTAQWNSVALRPDAHFCAGAVIVDGELRRILAPHFSYDHPPSEHAPTIRVTPHALDSTVARMAADGAICVKTIDQQGFVQPTVDDTRALVAAAHAHGLPVFIHANRENSQALAVAAGVDVIVHGMWRDLGEDATLDAKAREILSSIARDRIGYQPTTQVIVGLRDMMRADYLARPELADVYPRTLINFYASKEGGWYADYIKKLNVSNGETFFRETIERADAGTRILARADAHLLFGSDTPSDFVYTNPPGLNGRLEMNNWIASGVSPAKLFGALTIENARELRLDKEIGTVEPGKAANLLLLHANPLDGVEAYDTIERVFLHGRPIVRSELSARH